MTLRSCAVMRRRAGREAPDSVMNCAPRGFPLDILIGESPPGEWGEPQLSIVGDQVKSSNHKGIGARNPLCIRGWRGPRAAAISGLGFTART